MAAFGEGWATGPDLPGCAERAAAQAVRSLVGRPADLAAVFVSVGPGADPAAAEAALLRASALLGAAHTIGCTAGGVLGSGRGVEGAPAVAVWAASLPGARVRSFQLEVLAGEVLGWPEPVGGVVADRAVVLLSDPWSLPVGSVGAGALSSLPLVGGAASAGRAGAARLLLDGHVTERGAVGVVIGADPLELRVSTVRSQGCRRVGPPMAVTGARGDLVVGLSSTAAMTRLQQVIEGLDPLDQALASAEILLGVSLDEGAEDPDFDVRRISSVDSVTGGLRLGRVLAVGQTVQLHVLDPEWAGLDLRAALQSRAAGSGGALLVAGGDRGLDDALALREALGSPAVAGFVGGPSSFAASVLALGDARG